MPARRFVRLLLTSYACVLVIFFLLDGAAWLRGRSWLLSLFFTAGVVFVWVLAGARIRRAVRWLALGEGTPPEKSAS